VLSAATFFVSASVPWSARAGNRPHGQKEVLVIAKPVDLRIRVNEQIVARQVRVIDEEGNQLGIMAPPDALKDAYERGLDLVEVAPNASPTVCRIMDYGKYKYQQSKRVKESRKHQTVIHVKEVKYRPKIDDHDFDYKTNHVREFLTEGNKVKVTITFRGREMAHPEFGNQILQRVIEATKDLCQEQFDTSRVRLEGRQMVIVMSPTK
jgi:translation initiation factor IF-3